jgi:hypothetical protein
VSGWNGGDWAAQTRVPGAGRGLQEDREQRGGNGAAKGRPLKALPSRAVPSAGHFLGLPLHPL